MCKIPCTFRPQIEQLLERRPTSFGPSRLWAVDLTEAFQLEASHGVPAVVHVASMLYARQHCFVACLTRLVTGQASVASQVIHRLNQA
jgi:hypothetical protein